MTDLRKLGAMWRPADAGDEKGAKLKAAGIAISKMGVNSTKKELPSWTSLI